MRGLSRLPLIDSARTLMCTCGLAWWSCMFARSQNLSPSEEAVLLALCRGSSIPEIAADHKVAESTVRSQIKALREKTGCGSIRALMQRVHSLPPVVPALRVISAMSHNAMEFAQP